LQEFSQLCALDLSDNRLSCIAGLAWLPALQQLILSANRLRDLQGLTQVLSSSSSSSSDAAAEGVANAAADAASGEKQQQQWQDTEGQGSEEPDAAVVPEQCTVVRQSCWPSGFSCLRLLDVSFNLIPAEQLLGLSSPLAHLPR
jgi:Leucine-rich repeat (LRR) protein